jgi:BolA family transcriptional regulator, general stress-responsive regulator
MAVTREDIERALRQALAPLHLDVQDDSHLHIGHAGAREGRHFSVAVTAEAFRGLSRLRRHRLVYDAVAPLLTQGIHALAIDAHAPGDS